MSDFDSPPSEEGAPAWMATFADLSTLLLTFFILLLSFAEMDVVKFKDMLGSMDQAFGFDETTRGNSSPREMSIAPQVKATSSAQSVADKQADGQTEKASRQAVDRQLLDRVNQVVKDQELEQSVDVNATPRGIVVRVRDQLMFPQGGAKLRNNARYFLEELSQIIRRFPYNILIEGHTDNRPMRSKRYPTNWELSAHRAVTVLRFLITTTGIEATRLGAAGYADTRPIASNDTAKGRASNRRVEFVCYRDVDLRGRPSNIKPAANPKGAR